MIQKRSTQSRPRERRYLIKERQVTDEKAIRIALLSPYNPQRVKLRDDDLMKPYGVIIVDLTTRPPTVTRVDDEFPHLR